MKSPILLVTSLFFSTFIFAQKNDSKSQKSIKKNIVKVNLSSLALKNVAVQFERAIGKKTSVALGVRVEPYGSIPFKSKIEDAVDDPNVQVGSIKVGNVAFTPEFRYYLGKAAMKGFYVAPYGRYANYKMQAPISYTSGSITKSALFTGNISSFSGGLMMGSQFRIAKNIVLDWWILGLHYGSSDGNLAVITPLTTQEQDDLEATLNDIDVPLFKIKSTVDANGATISSKGAWAGVRAFGINLGIKF